MQRNLASISSLPVRGDGDGEEVARRTPPRPTDLKPVFWRHRRIRQNKDNGNDGNEDSRVDSRLWRDCHMVKSQSMLRGGS